MGEYPIVSFLCLSDNILTALERRRMLKFEEVKPVATSCQRYTTPQQSDITQCIKQIISLKSIS